MPCARCVRTPAFTLTAIGTLALGMGPTLVIANLVERVVVRPAAVCAAGSPRRGLERATREEPP